MSNTIAISLHLVTFYSHCVKSVRIPSFSGMHFPAFGLTTERYEVSLGIQSEYRKARTRITPKTDTFHSVSASFVGVTF